MEQAELYEKILDSIDASLYVIDIKDYTIIAANEASGFKEKVGKAKCYELTHHRDTPCNSISDPCPLNIIKQTKKSTIVEHVHYDLEGNKKSVQVNGYPVFDKSGNLISMIELCIDITSRVNLESALKESEEKYRTLIENANEAITVAQDAKLVFVNPKAVEITGYSLEEMTSKPFLEFVHPDDRALVGNNYIKRMQNEGAQNNYQFRIINKFGNANWMEINAVLIQWQGKPATLNFLIDITKRKKAEDELREITSSKDKFYSIIAHDLRGPMGTLMKLSALLADEFDTFDLEDRNMFLKEIKESSKNIFNLLENLLTWSRAQKGMIEFNQENINLHNAVEHILKYLKMVAATKKIIIKSNIPDNVMIFADENMIKTIIRNFVANAIKFSPEEGYITISHKIEDAFMRITVTDNGVGMDEETIANLFKLDVHHSNEGTAGEKGTGLGLILCKEFTERHGGRILAESEIGKGSSFSFTIPLKD